MESFAIECLDAHNTFRQRHGVPPLLLDDDMCATSQHWADYLMAKKCFIPSNMKKYGENLYSVVAPTTDFTISGAEPVDNWYKEIKFHTFGVEPRIFLSSHFTQVVWKNTEKMGVAFKKSGRKMVVVAHYFPPGNYEGQFVKNVMPLGYMRARKQLEIGFEREVLNAHNRYRLYHGVPALELDKEMCKYSKYWAQQLAHKGKLLHRPNSSFGENLFSVKISTCEYIIKGNLPVDKWYAEVKKHVFGKQTNNYRTSLFCQVIWKSTKYLGVGMAINNGVLYVVSNYSPPGNIVGRYASNVLPPKYLVKMKK